MPLPLSKIHPNLMSIRIMTQVWAADLDSATQKIVLLALADNANDEGWCWPAIGTIAKKCSLSDRTVQDQIAILSTKKLLTIKAGGGRVTNQYQITISANSPSEGCAKITGAQISPLTQDHPRGAPGSPQGCGTITAGVRQLPTIHQGTVIEPSMKQRRPEDVAIPPELWSEDFKAAWLEWIADRKDRHKPMTARAAELRLAEMKKWGPARAIAAIRHSMMNQYQGIFESKDTNGSTYSKTNQRNPAENPRNIGTYTPKTDYAAVLARRERAALVGQVAENPAPREQGAAGT